MEDKSRVIITMRKLSKEINKYHPDTETAKFVDDTLSRLQRSEGVAFTGCLQYFFNKVSVVKFSEDITFNESEKKYWREIHSYKELGNNLWGASL